MTEADSRPRERHPAGALDDNLGVVLRRAREQRELDVEELARRLRLEPRVLRMLENNLFEELPAPAFARGYVRAIARELGIDGAPLLAELDHRLADLTPALADFESRAPIQITSDSNIVRYTTIALVGAMVILIVLWWRSHGSVLPGFSDLTTSTLPEETPMAPVAQTPPLSYSYEVVTHPDDPFYRAELPPLVLAEAPVAIAAAAPTASGPSGADLVIAAREDAWIQVLDVNGERLYYNIVRAGNRIEIEGRRPYSLVIGNAPAVSLLFEGQAIDVEALSAEGVARFQLGQDPSAQ